MITAIYDLCLYILSVDYHEFVEQLLSCFSFPPLVWGPTLLLRLYYT